jgi:hypothetical protein
MTKVTAGIVLLPKGDFEFAVKECKTFSRQSTDPNTQETKDVYGVQYNLEVVGGSDDSFVGKTIPLQIYMHAGDAALSIGKRFIMASLGFALNAEAEFNEKYADADWSVDPEENFAGDIWQSVVGTRVAATTDQKPDKRDSSRMNQVFNWRPI